jgi:beta-1,4-N-acetylglucosaminyltransferase
MIFVSVGTGAFDQLIKSVDELGISDAFYQIGNGTYVPQGNYVRLLDSERFEECLEKAELVITHAGAGNLYTLLERGKKFVAVPNFQRTDQHQTEICKYVESNNLGCVCWDCEMLKQCIENSLSKSFSPYVKTSFSAYPDILG